jgi:hypothetical protein
LTPNGKSRQEVAAVCTARNVIRSVLLACIAGCLLSLCSTAAIAAATYTLTVTVTPSNVPRYSNFTIAAVGVSSKRSDLEVYANKVSACAATASADAAAPGDFVDISQHVRGTFKKTVPLTALSTGAHFACGYLVGSSRAKKPHAAASAPYTVG